MRTVWESPFSSSIFWKAFTLLPDPFGRKIWPSQVGDRSYLEPELSLEAEGKHYFRSHQTYRLWLWKINSKRHE